MVDIMESDVIRGSNTLIRSIYSTQLPLEGNYIFSPLSLHELLTVVSQDPGYGSRENFAQILYTSELDQATKHYKNIIAYLSSLTGITLQISNKAFLQENYEFHEAFKKLLAEDLSFEIGSVDKNSVDTAAKSTNTWVKDEMDQQIGDFVNPRILKNDTCLSLSNTFNFSGKWAQPFKIENTTLAPFNFDGGSVEVNMMKARIQTNYKYVEYLNLQILELPYTNDDVSLFILLPNKDTIIENIEQEFNWYTSNYLLDNMNKSEVDVSLPKFKVEKAHDLKGILMQSGLKDDLETNLFGMFSGGEFVNVNEIHEAGIFSVHEEGSEAASGTILTFVPSKADDKEYPPEDGLVIYEMDIKANVANRFAKNLVTCKVRNTNKTAKEATFTVVLPETAFIVKFVMEIEGKTYESYIKEKEKAKAIYNKAVASGRSAGIVEASARDSNEFNVSVNLEPDSEAVFSLTYEEMLQRIHDQYELVLNIRPGQVVETLNVEVNINESRPLKFVKTPALRSGNEISRNEEYLKPSADVKINKNSAVVKFNPDAKQQKKIAGYLGMKMDKGFCGQFVVQYDVEREPRNGEILLQDGYFVHFFAPNDLDPIPRHVVFILDTSTSMEGRKISQLKDAMRSILNELRNHDIFSLVEFNSDVIVWDIDSENPVVLKDFENVEDPFSKISELQGLPPPTYANKEAISKAKSVVQKINVTGCTYISGGLVAALYLVKNQQRRVANKSEKHQPILIFLTDGEPNVGISSTGQIVKMITQLNFKNNKAPIFSLSFGDGADKEFLRELSLKNLGFSRHIYEASDASLQLKSFYKQISSPLLTDITFRYDSADEVTNSSFPIYFRGAEIVVSGRYTDPSLSATIDCCGFRGPITLRSVVERTVTSLERLWAYLMVRQLLEQIKTTQDKIELTKKATEISLKYSFVTEVTSLVVVKPDASSAVNIGQEDDIVEEDDVGEEDDTEEEESQSDIEDQVQFHRAVLCSASARSDDYLVFPEVQAAVLKKKKHKKYLDESFLQLDYIQSENDDGATEKKIPKKDSPIEFTADRPFLIVVRHRKENRDVILFVGRVYKP